MLYMLSHIKFVLDLQTVTNNYMEDAIICGM